MAAFGAEEPISSTRPNDCYCGQKRTLGYGPLGSPGLIKLGISRTAP